MRRLISACRLLVGAGCNRNDSAADRKEHEPSTAQVAADNTKKNERDQHGAALTAGDQPENEADLTIAQHVRQEVVKQDALSMNAKNVKIVSVNGVVTLRGPVKSAAEKTEVERIARSTQGVTRVDNQLEIAAN